MRTDDLIRALAEDKTPQLMSLGKAVLFALTLSIPLSAAILIVSMGFRPDISTALELWRFDFKYAVAFTLAATSGFLVLRISRPGASTELAKSCLFLVPAVVLAGVVAELFILPQDAWARAAIGNYAVVCVTVISLISLPILAALFVVLRRGAPSSPATAGATSGLLAAAFGTAVYALHCPNDSPLYLAIWYMTAIGIVTLIGAITGHKMLRW